MTIAAYAGSFDLFTYGHKEVADGALRVCDRLIVAVGRNRTKSPILSPENRKASAKYYFEGDSRVEVDHFNGIFADHCAAIAEREKEPVVMVRGLRALSDFEAEMALADANRRLQPGIQTIFIPTTSECAFISSTTVREIALLTGSNKERLLPYVNEKVADLLSYVLHLGVRI